MSKVASIAGSLGLKAANRVDWYEGTSMHLGSSFYDVERWLRDARGPRRREIQALGDVSGLRHLHLQCHFGFDILACARAGARVPGLDLSSPWRLPGRSPSGLR